MQSLSLSKYGTHPELMGTFDLDFTEYMHFMYLPIRITDHNWWRLAVPERLAFALPMIYRCVGNEVELGNAWRYVYVTARRGYATPGNPLNRPGWHSDGFGTPDINYVWTDRFPTDFAIQPFYSISDDHVKSLRQFEQQIIEDRIVQFGDRELMRLDDTVIHRAPEIPAPGGERSFFKVSFSNERYNLVGNSHNYLLDYEWEMHDRQAVRNDPASAGKDAPS